MGIISYFKTKRSAEGKPNKIRFDGILTIETGKGLFCFIGFGVVLLVASLYFSVSFAKAKESIDVQDSQLSAVVPNGTALSLIPLIKFSTPVYDQHAKNIGMFKGKWVAKVAKFYGYLQFINSLQKARPEYIMLNRRHEFDDIYQGSLNTICKDFYEEFQNAFKAYKA